MLTAGRNVKSRSNRAVTDLFTAVSATRNTDHREDINVSGQIGVLWSEQKREAKQKRG